MKNIAGATDEFIRVRVQKTQERFKRIRNTSGPTLGVGEFFLLIDITALKEAVYIPLSIASGKKPTGFVYQIEGTAQGSIATTHISSKGDGITHITLGTMQYAKIPAGMTATFRLLIEMRGQVPKSYNIVIHRIHYKLDPSDARYIKLEGALATNALKFN